MKFVQFPQFRNFPNILNIGKTNAMQHNKNKNVLVILDITDSMNEYINEFNNDGTKINMAIKIVEKLEKKYQNYNFDVLPFNTKTYPLCTINTIPTVENCTYFSPIIPALKSIINNYQSVIFMSDGLPTEDIDIAYDSIYMCGKICREASAKTISVAIGTDADGYACSLFAGNRGINCFIKYSNELNKVIYDISTGIETKYIYLEMFDDYVPIEHNEYYYVSNKIIGSNQLITPFLIKKYINLVILKKINEPNYNPDELYDFIQFILYKTEILDNYEINQFNEYFSIILNNINNTHSKHMYSNSKISAINQTYRNFSQQF